MTKGAKKQCVIEYGLKKLSMSTLKAATDSQISKKTSLIISRLKTVKSLILPFWTGFVYITLY
jgi:hypothetical protein